MSPLPRPTAPAERVVAVVVVYERIVSFSTITWYLVPLLHVKAKALGMGKKKYGENGFIVAWSPSIIWNPLF